MKTDAQAIARRPVISALGVICAVQFVLQLDFSIVNVALPTIQRELGFAPADLQWVVTGYALTFGSLLLLGGRAGDLLGAVLAAYVYFTSLYMQRVLGVSALLTGLALLPSTVTIVLMSTFATRRLLDRLGVKRMLLLGLTSMGLGLLVFSFVTAGAVTSSTCCPECC
jgi:MFS family permease